MVFSTFSYTRLFNTFLHQLLNGLKGTQFNWMYGLYTQKLKNLCGWHCSWNNAHYKHHQNNLLYIRVSFRLYRRKHVHWTVIAKHNAIACKMIRQNDWTLNKWLLNGILWAGGDFPLSVQNYVANAELY